jgi:hypothetical protein
MGEAGGQESPSRNNIQVGGKFDQGENQTHNRSEETFSQLLVKFCFIHT